MACGDAEVPRPLRPQTCTRLRLFTVLIVQDIWRYFSFYDNLALLLIVETMRDQV
jgi:hypothetical protein